MTVADLPLIVAAAPGTALLCAFVLGAVIAGVSVGGWWLLSWLDADDSAHEQRCASCAGGLDDRAEPVEVGGGE